MRRPRRGRCAVAHGLLLLPLLVLPAGASAGELSLRATVIPGTRYEPERTTVSGRYVAAPGEVNDVRAEVRDGILLLSDAAGVRATSPACDVVSPTAVRCVVTQELEGLDVSDAAGLTAGGGCTATGPTSARCPVPSTLTSVAVELGDGDDAIVAPDLPAIVDGGPGADAVDAGKVTYAGATGRVRIDLGAGAGAEGDVLGARVRGVIGGPFADEIVGTPGADALDGGPGDDLVDGRSGDDRLDGGAGADRLAGSTGADAIYGRDGADTIDGAGGEDLLYGDGGDDIVTGGDGEDVVQGDDGADRLVGGAGADRIWAAGSGIDAIDARDGTLDLVSCLGGRLTADARDLAKGCATVDRGSVARPQMVSLVPSDRAIHVDVGCSQEQRRCRIALRLEAYGRTLDRDLVRIRGGSGAQRHLLIPSRLFRRMTGGCRLMRGTMVMTSRDAKDRPVVTRRAFTTGSSRCGRPQPPPPRVDTAVW